MARRIFRTTYSKGRPSRSYIAMKKAGSMRAIIRNIAPVFPSVLRVCRYPGLPTTAAPPIQLTWRLVR